MPTPEGFGRRKHFEGDGCDPGKCPEDRALPYPPRPTVGEELERIERENQSPYLTKQRMFRGSTE